MDYEGALVVETLSQADGTCRPSKIITLCDTQEAAQPASMDMQGGDDSEYSAGRDKNQDEIAEDNAWISMPFKVIIVVVFLHCKLHEIYVASIMWITPILRLLRKVLLQSKSHPFREYSS